MEKNKYRIRKIPWRCTGCQACVIACMDQNDLDPGQGETAFCRVEETECSMGRTAADGEGKAWLLSWDFISCRHCDEPACVTACVNDGLWREEETGLVLYDAARCAGCGKCLKVCETDAISFDRNRRIKKCDGCRERLRAGLLPACVRACPSGAVFLYKET